MGFFSAIMRARAVILAGLALAFSPAAAPAAAQGPMQPLVQVEIVSARSAVAPGETVTLGWRQVMTDGWHTYWLNPGDAGEAPEIEWRLPPGYETGPLRWPTPTVFALGEGETRLANYVYEHEVILPFALTVPADAPIGQTVTLEGQGYWLVCDDQSCVPEEAPVSVALNIRAAGEDDPAWAARLAAIDAALPREAGLSAQISPQGRLSVTGAALQEALGRGPIRDAHFFPFSRDVIDHNRPQAPAQGAQGLSFDLAPGVAGPLGQTPLAGVIGFSQERDGAWVRIGFEVNAQPGAADPAAAGVAVAGGYGGGGAVVAAEAPPAAAALTLPLALLFAFLGGLILNVMPCVFPILSVKALSFAGGAHSGEAPRHGLLFLAGVMATFAVLAGVLLSLQAAGAAAGWGFQLQQPWFMGGLALLFFVIGLNLLGVFEIGAGVQNVGAGLAQRGGDMGAFFTGVLAVVAATPCTAPFMAGALGFAAAQPAPVALGVFLALGLGFAAPFVALSFAPGLRGLLPKPGPWMDRLKQFFAFPMFATAVWAAWVTSGQTGPAGVLALLSLAVAIGFVIWALRALRTIQWRAASVAVAVLAVAGVAFAMRPLPFTVEPWSAARVEALQQEGRAVFVNFTADWCVTCKVNERTSLSSERVGRAFATAGVAYLKADWTNNDPVIADALAAHGRAGVPLYLLFPGEPGAPPQILPQVLTERIVLDAIAQR